MFARCLSLLLVLVTLAPLSAQDLAGRTLTIGIKEAPPFSMRDEQGRWTGLSVALVEAVARELECELRFEEATLTELLERTQVGKVDLAAAAITLTPEREKVMDFSHPYMEAGLGIAVPAKPASAWSSALKRFVSLDFLKVLLALSALLLVVGGLVWFFERRKNTDEFDPRGRGVLEGFWWAAVTMTTVGYGDRSPRTGGGRAVALVWMFASIILISGFTAAIAASLTVSELESPITGPADLARHRVATVTGSASAQYMERKGLPRVANASLAEALKSLDAGEVDAVVYDAPLLRYSVREQFAGSLQVLPVTFERAHYALAFPEKSELRESFNRVLLEVTSSLEWQERLERYFGS